MALTFPDYAITTASPDDPPNPAPVDLTWSAATLPRRKWWTQFDPLERDENYFITPDVVYTICAWAAKQARAIDAIVVLVQEDPDTGLQVPQDVHYRGLAVLFIEAFTDTVICANPASSAITYLPAHWVTYLRIDPFTGDEQARMDFS